MLIAAKPTFAKLSGAFSVCAFQCYESSKAPCSVRRSLRTEQKREEVGGGDADDVQRSGTVTDATRWAHLAVTRMKENYPRGFAEALLLYLRAPHVVLRCTRARASVIVL